MKNCHNKDDKKIENSDEANILSFRSSIQYLVGSLLAFVVLISVCCLRNDLNE